MPTAYIYRIDSVAVHIVIPPNSSWTKWWSIMAGQFGAKKRDAYAAVLLSRNPLGKLQVEGEYGGRGACLDKAEYLALKAGREMGSHGAPPSMQSSVSQLGDLYIPPSIGKVELAGSGKAAGRAVLLTIPAGRQILCPLANTAAAGLPLNQLVPGQKTLNF